MLSIDMGNVTKVLTFTVTTFALIVYFLYKGGISFFMRFYSLPPTYFREAIEEAVNNSGSIKPSKVGIKKSSYRRRLLLASKKPQLYSTVPLVTNENTNSNDKIYNRLRIARIDSEDNKESFLDLIKPLDPQDSKRKVLYGFFHPNSFARGGGERVLWEAVYSTLKLESNAVAIIYTFTPNDSTSVSWILTSVKKTFGIDFFKNDDLKDRIVFIQLNNKYKWLIDGSSYKFLTIIGQIFGSFIIMFMSFYQVLPDIFIDTMGFPFIYPFIHIFLDLPIISYIHYPIVSGDMIKKAKLLPGFWGYGKYIYWSLMLKLYEFSGAFADTLACNSTWTLENVKESWSIIGNEIEPVIVYPPSGISYEDVKDCLTWPREKVMIYIGQFRPEKRHSLLLKNYKEYLENAKKLNIDVYKLVLIGSTRSEKDEESIKVLKELIENLEIPEGLVKFEINASNDLMEDYLKKAEYGLNCMWKEHFGISVVEYIMYGCIPIVHASAGPLLDIVVPINPRTGALLSEKERKESIKIDPSYQSGFFFKDESDPDYTTSSIENYDNLANVLLKATSSSDGEKFQYRLNCTRVGARKFGKNVFEKEWNEIVLYASTLETLKRKDRGKVERVY